MDEPITPIVVESKLYNLTEQNKVNWYAVGHNEHGEANLWEADVAGIVFQLNVYGRLSIPVDKSVESPKGYEIQGYVSTSYNNHSLIRLVKNKCSDNNYHDAAKAAALQAFKALETL